MTVDGNDGVTLPILAVLDCPVASQVLINAYCKSTEARERSVLQISNKYYSAIVELE